MTIDSRKELSEKLKQEIGNFVLSLGEAARSIIKDITKTDFRPSIKTDKSFVTEADTSIERIFRERIQKQYPSHGIVGEEFPSYQEENEFVWLLDPIDGTEEFVYGVPTYGSIISLLYHQKPIATFIDNQALDLKTLAVFGMGLRTNGGQAVVRKDCQQIPKDLCSARLGISKKTNFTRLGDETVIFNSFTSKFPNIRIFDSCFAYTSVAQGMLHAMLDVNVRSWDILGVELLCTEQGLDFKLLRDTEEGLRNSRYSAAFGHPLLVEMLSVNLKDKSL
jgi:fructose-1,6-bisphosphatase/inositol monophosphatase family enzyme